MLAPSWVLPLTAMSVTPLMAPPTAASPVMVSERALPAKVLCVVTAEPLSVVLVPSVTASAKVWAPLVRRLPPLTAVLPAASVLRLLSFSLSGPLPSGAPPTAPPSVVSPLSLIVKLRFVPSDFTVPASVMATPVKLVSAPSVTAPL